MNEFKEIAISIGAALRVIKEKFPNEFKKYHDLEKAQQARRELKKK